LEDLDFADGIASVSSRHDYMQEKKDSVTLQNKLDYNSTQKKQKK
jgi:hypothetical protein